MIAVLAKRYTVKISADFEGVVEADSEEEAWEIALDKFNAEREIVSSDVAEVDESDDATQPQRSRQSSMTRRQMEETCECNMVEPEICNCDLDLCERCRERARKGYEQAIQNATFNVKFPGAGDWEYVGHE